MEENALRIMTLNTWGGRCFDDLTAYLKAMRETVDVFCFQEVFDFEVSSFIKWTSDNREARADIFRELRCALPGHIGFFAPALTDFDYQGRVPGLGLKYGLATFVRRETVCLGYANEYVWGHHGMHEHDPSTITQRNVLTMLLTHRGVGWAVFNFHGLHVPDEKGLQAKGDRPERLEQARRLRALVNRLGRESRVVLCGDFNLRPDTQSMALIEAGEGERPGIRLDNLVRRHEVTDTRTSHYPAERATRYADYILVSPNLEVLEFGIERRVEVSDHAPLIATLR